MELERRPIRATYGVERDIAFKCPFGECWFSWLCMRDVEHSEAELAARLTLARRQWPVCHGAADWNGPRECIAREWVKRQAFREWWVAPTVGVVVL